MRFRTEEYETEITMVFIIVVLLVANYAIFWLRVNGFLV